MTESSLYRMNLAVIALATFVLLVVAAEVAHWWGRRTRAKFPNDSESMLELIPTTILGLLALLIGFTFSMSISRFDTRKQLVNEEANAIGTAYLRTDVLPEPFKQKSRQLLQQYLAERLEFFEQVREESSRTEYLRRISATQDQLWQLAIENAKTDRTAVSSLYLQSLNEMIDLDAKRLFATRDQVPDAVYFTLTIFAVFGLASLSRLLGWYGRSHRSLVMLALLFTIVIALIQDLDRPGRGLIRVNTSSLQDLSARLAGA
jgi:hypothetical protein